MCTWFIAYGVLLPTSVRYEKRVDYQPVLWNLATYLDYRMFDADSEIRFEPEPQIVEMIKAASDGFTV